MVSDGPQGPIFYNSTAMSEQDPRSKLRMDSETPENGRRPSQTLNEAVSAVETLDSRDLAQSVPGALDAAQGEENGTEEPSKPPVAILGVPGKSFEFGDAQEQKVVAGAKLQGLPAGTRVETGEGSISEYEAIDTGTKLQGLKSESHAPVEETDNAESNQGSQKPRAETISSKGSEANKLQGLTAESRAEVEEASISEPKTSAENFSNRGSEANKLQGLTPESRAEAEDASQDSTKPKLQGSLYTSRGENEEVVSSTKPSYVGMISSDEAAHLELPSLPPKVPMKSEAAAAAVSTSRLLKRPRSYSSNNALDQLTAVESESALNGGILRIPTFSSRGGFHSRSHSMSRSPVSPVGLTEMTQANGDATKLCQDHPSVNGQPANGPVKNEATKAPSLGGGSARSNSRPGLDAFVSADEDSQLEHPTADDVTKLPEDDFIRYFVKDGDPEEDEGGLASVSFFDWLRQDLGFDVDEDQAFSSKNASVEDDVFNFIRVPMEVEKLLFFGFFLCCDSLLFVLIFLPLRIIRAIFLLICSLVLPNDASWTELRFHRAQFYDLLRGSIILIAFAVLLQAHMSRIYHFVRGQAFIKLYVIFNMLDIFDRLMCSFGQDIMDSLFYMTKTSPWAVWRIAFRFILGVVYVTLHSLLYFVRLVTLNAAINSTSNALLTILISNNFVELKGSVFKRFAEQNVFQITCSDMVERFELFVFLLLTAMQSTETWTEFLYSSAMYVFVCELLVDWIKHAFITKFNRIHFSCYGNFLEAICRDIAPVSSRKHPYATSQRLGERPVDATQAVAQRIGLATMPLTCVVLRFVYVNVPTELHENPFALPNAVFLILCYLCLFALKTLLNIILKGHACEVLMRRERSILRNSSPQLSNIPSTPREKELQKALVAKQMQKIDQLAQIRRYQIFKSRVPT